MIATYWVFIAFVTGLALGAAAIWRWLPGQAAETVAEPPPKPARAVPDEEPVEAAPNEIAAYLDANQRVVDELQRKYSQGPPTESETPRRRSPRPKPGPRRKA